MINNNGVETLYYGYTDNQGSLVALTDENGTVVERYAYDPWGARRNPDNWAEKDSRTSWLVNRGYTGHEHLDAFGIINMNGRVYDPATAQFFSPDPFIQAPDSWNNFNRYAYCMNNPVMYTDPSGYNYFKYSNLETESEKKSGALKHEYAYFPGELGTNMGYVGGFGNGADLVNPYSFNNRWNAYFESKSKGWAGNFSEFQTLAFQNGLSGSLTLHNFKHITTASYQNNMLIDITITAIVTRTYTVNIGGGGIGGNSIGGGANLWDYISNGASVASVYPTIKGTFSFYEKGFDIRWTGKNGNYYRLSQVKNNGGYIKSMNYAQKVSKLTRGLGNGLTGLSIVTSIGSVGMNYYNGTDNTSTWVGAVIGIGTGILTLAAAPAVVTGAAIVGGVWGVGQLVAGDEINGWIDNNFGYK